MGLQQAGAQQGAGGQSGFSLDIEGQRYYPAFFLDPRYDRAKLEKVSKVLGDLPAAAPSQERRRCKHWRRVSSTR